MADRTKPLARLRGEQLQATDPAELVWLSASAGTGKTHVLTSRVLRLLLGGARPETILCLTFTKAGAAEMASRIQGLLARWVSLKKDVDVATDLAALGESPSAESIADARRLFARVLDAPGGGLRIQTIHAFCQTLLAGFPVEAGLTPGFRPLEGREQAALARRALADLLSGAERGGRLGLVADVQRLSRRLGEAKAESYLMACARDPEAMAALGPAPGIEPRLRRALDVPAGDVEEVLRQACADVPPRLTTIAAANAAWGTTRGLERADIIARWLAADPAARAASLADLHLVWATKSGDPRSFARGQAPQDPDYEAHCRALSDWCAALLGLRKRAALAALLAAGLRAGQAYADAYAAAKRAAGALDFDDLIRHAHRLLTTEHMGDWVRYKLDQATDHILVDEAQDTNARQWAIVAALAGEFFAGEGARPDAHRTIFTVGDFKQAIFGFQGTDPLAFEAAGIHFRAKAEDARRDLLRLSLDRSFRSTPPVLALVDRLLEDVGAENLGVEERLRPHVSAKGGPGAVLLWRPLSLEAAADEAEGEEEWVDDATRAFAARLAKQVAAWLADPFLVHVRGRPLRPEDVMILVRKRGELASLLVARLHEEGVPVAGVDRLRLTAPLAVRDLLAAIRFALQPADDLSLAALLVSPLFGWTQDQLYALGFRRNSSLYNALREKAEFASTMADVARMLASVDFTTPYQFLETILSGPLDGRRKLLARLGHEARDPIEELLSAALQFEADQTPSLQRFLDWFDRGEVEIVRDPSAPLDAVRVMTVHGAKGLQAPLVILADATGDPELSPASSVKWTIGEDEPAVPILTPRKDERTGGIARDHDAAKARELQEHWRLLYVAATRAEERLVIGGALGARAKGEAPRKSWYQAIDRALEGLGAGWADDDLWTGVRHYRGDTPAAVVPPTKIARPLAAPVAEPAWLRHPAPPEARPPRPLAPSSLGIDVVADPPPSLAMLDAARRGQLLHTLFERLPALAPDRREAAALRWLERSAGVADAGLRAELVASACAIIADPRHAALFAPDALAEAPIAAVVGGDVIAGTVDRLLVGDARVEIVDFKTGRRVPADAASAPAHHLRQMAAYVGALGVIFPGREIVASLLYTAGPSLIALPPDLLARHKPGLTG